MKANFESMLKNSAIKSVKTFSSFKANRIKVISNSANYPKSITLSYDVYCDSSVDGYILCNAVTNEHYALTAIELSTALNSMINNSKCWKPRSKDSDLLRLTFDTIINYKF